jgi:hypothetical protein
MELAQPGGELRPQRRVDHPAGPRILFADPGLRDRIAGGLEDAERIGNGDAVERLDQIAARVSQRLPAA